MSRFANAIAMPPDMLVRRVLREVRAEIRGLLGEPYRGDRQLLRALGADDINDAWERLAAARYPASDSVTAMACDNLCIGGTERIIRLADRAIHREVSLLGETTFKLVDPVDWHADFQHGVRWAKDYYRRIDYLRLDERSDVKVPWELSRLQWALPLAQGYRLTQSPRYAVAARDLLEDWISANEFGVGVNWTCTMEVALRFVCWTWLFDAFKNSDAWNDGAFRVRFLRAALGMCSFIEWNIEESAINGNHYVADAAALVYAGLFFEGSKAAARWLSAGWNILTREIFRQTTDDGVDYEGSVAYHRLVMECFFMPAYYRKLRERPVPAEYLRRLRGMAEFVEAYSRPDGTSPILGDADDGRFLPLGGQPLSDHRYLGGLLRSAWPALDAPYAGGPVDEVFWTCGPEHAQACCSAHKTPSGLKCFRSGGYCVLRNAQDHVFIDCATVGLAGRGGHGHNDCLSFEAILGGVPIVTDSGMPCYTYSYETYNNFRSTAAHNTPQIDHRELNRLRSPRRMWALHADAVPTIHDVGMTSGTSWVEASHGAYRRLREPVTVRRRISLSEATHTLLVYDVFVGAGTHWIDVRLHLHPDVEVCAIRNRQVTLRSGSETFLVEWVEAAWAIARETGAVAFSYGTQRSRSILRWSASVDLPASLSVSIAPVLCESNRASRPPAGAIT